MSVGDVATTYVPAVSLYFADRGSRMSVPIAEAVTLADEAILILGRMRGGHMGRELVTIEDLRRWDHEDEMAAEWAAVVDGERFAAENGLLR